MKRFQQSTLAKSTLSLLLAGALAGCYGGEGTDSKTQRLQGHIPLDHYSAEIVGVRVVADGQAVAAVETDALGNFDIAVPRGLNYSFEVVTRSGSHQVLTGPITGASPLTFDVCDPGEDFDLGDINPFDFEEIDGDDNPWSDTEDDCVVPPWICEDPGWDEPWPDTDPNGDPSQPPPNTDPVDPDCWSEPLPCDDPAADPDFCWVDPLPCDDPEADPDFCWDDTPCDDYDGNGTDPDCPPVPCDAMDGSDCEPWPPVCDDPNDPDCGWMPCDDPSDPNCGPWECDDPNDPDCYNPPPPCQDSDGDGSCGGCDSTNPDPSCDPWFPTPCDATDPTDPNCDDPWDGSCANDYDDPSCWPEPDICILTPDGGFEECDDDTGAAPDFPFPDFGCEAP